MTQTPIPKLVLSLGLPTTISMLVTNIYNMADTYFVSQLGTSASGAVGIVFGLMSILQAFGFMLGQGAGSILSRSLGEKDVGRASRIASKGFFASLFAGVAIGAVGLIFLTPLMRLLGSTNTILPYARTYGIFILLAAPLMTASFTMNNILRYEGRAMYAMVGLTAGGVLNIFGDWLLMEQMDFGIAGAGISTALSQMVSFGLLLSMFLRGKTQSRLSFTKFLESTEQMTAGAEFAEIVRIGFPSLVRQGLSSVSTMLLNGQAGMYGDAAVAAMAIVNRICFFVFAVGLGIGQGYQPVCAFNYGAKKYSRVRQGFFFTWLVGEVLLGTMIVGGMVVSDHLIAVFRDDATVIEIGTMALRIQLAALLFQPLTVCTNMTYQSVGRSRGATILSSLRSGVIFIPVLLLTTRWFGLVGVEIAQPVADVLTCLVSIPFVVIFFKGLPQETEERADL